MPIITKSHQINISFLSHYCRRPKCLNIAKKGDIFCQSCIDEATNKEGFININDRPHVMPKDMCYVYFVEIDGDDAIKIGKARKMKHRLSSMQTSTPKEIRLIVKFLTFNCIEQKLHEIFSEYRIKGEWFKPNEKLLDLIESLKAGNTPDYVKALEEEYKTEKALKKKELFAIIDSL